MPANPAIPYSLEFKLVGLPKTGNQLLRGHWRVKHGHAKLWKRKVWAQCWPNRPPEPLLKALLTLTRVSSVECDYDNLVSSFKPVIDGLVEAKVLANDKQSNIGGSRYLWERGRRGHGHIRVIVNAGNKQD